MEEETKALGNDLSLLGSYLAKDNKSSNSRKKKKNKKLEQATTTTTTRERVDERGEGREGTQKKKKEKDWRSDKAERNAQKKAREKTSSNRKKKRKEFFSDYVKLSEVEDGLSENLFVKGHIRINPRRREDAYVTVTGLDVDIIVKGDAQNRAFEGDEVAIQIRPLSEWDFLEEEEEKKSREESLEESLERLNLSAKSAIAENAGEGKRKGGKSKWTLEVLNEIGREMKRRPSGEVVHIIKPSHLREHVVCKLVNAGNVPSDPYKAVLEPIDEKLPRLLLDKKFAANLGLLEKAKDRFILVKQTRWMATSGRPYCKVLDILGKMSDMESQVSAVLMQQGIDKHTKDFSEEVLDCLPSTPWSISDEEVVRRRDLRDCRIFSIDPETARDLDDALSVEPLGGGKVRVGVHIADVSHFVRAATSLDEEAAERATSVYMVDGVLPMLPRLLCEELCSLNPGTDRLSFSIIWEIVEETCEIQSQWIGKSIIRSCAKLHYGQAQEIIEGKPLTSSPHLHAYTLDDVVGDVKLLDKLAKKLRALRFESGALTLNIPRFRIILGKDNKTPIGAEQYVQKDSNYLVEEFMLLANRKVAEFISEKAPAAAVLRRHPPPHKRKIESLMKNIDEMKMNISMETHSSGAIHRSLEKIKREAEPHIHNAIVLMTTKPMQNAIYFCTGASDYIEKPDVWGHYALAFERYTHFTSPIRRYADVMVHRLVSDVLARENSKGKVETFESTGTRRSPWGRKFTERVVDQCVQCNRQKLAAKSVQEASNKLYLALWLSKQSYQTEGVITDLNGPKWMGIFVMEFGMEFKMYWEDQDEGDNFKAKWDNVNKQTTLYHGEETIMTLRNFQTVKVSLFSAFKQKSSKYEISYKVCYADAESSG